MLKVGLEYHKHLVLTDDLNNVRSNIVDLRGHVINLRGHLPQYLRPYCGLVVRERISGAGALNLIRSEQT